MKRKHLFPCLFSAVMLLFVLFLVWYIPSFSQRSFLLRDAQQSLETNQGRERKQQHEYDMVHDEIPTIQAELDQILPVTEAAGLELETLRAEKKKLKKEKKDLEKQLSNDPVKEDKDDE